MTEQTDELLPGSLIDMKFITRDSGMTFQWFYRMIKKNEFPAPIKLGRSSKWYYGEYSQWKSDRAKRSRNAP
ncbi:AlpA family phage regulatory protein [Sodalis ligni]|uniref:helix-turn-helix transcriptional regulator n=1 Tax=Sodalis ligni TaxID=2697027 RepID=UPI00193F9858|nr:AlpA family phage regulatory protein [Sodalis ligni]QWA09578.1 AlpA family phage regulatory protein [Sodalis ligni]